MTRTVLTALILAGAAWAQPAPLPVEPARTPARVMEAIGEPYTEVRYFNRRMKDTTPRTQEVLHGERNLQNLPINSSLDRRPGLPHDDIRDVPRWDTPLTR